MNTFKEILLKFRNYCLGFKYKNVMMVLLISCITLLNYILYNFEYIVYSKKIMTIIYLFTKNKLYIFFFFKIIILLLFILLIILIVSFFTLLERKIIAVVQERKGPNFVGFLGLLQPISDGFKLLLKEQITPTKSYKKLFLISSVISFVSSFLIWMVIPFFLDININIYIDILFIFSIMGLSSYGLIFAGWSSNSNYALLGSLRALAQFIAYEVIIGLLLLNIYLTNNSLNLFDIVNNQKNIWNIFISSWIFITLFILILAETNRTPFDLPEAEGELVSGFHTEYSSFLFALFSLAEYCTMLFWSNLMTLLVLGGWHSPLDLVLLYPIKLLYLFNSSFYYEIFSQIFDINIKNKELLLVYNIKTETYFSNYLDKVYLILSYHFDLYIYLFISFFKNSILYLSNNTNTININLDLIPLLKTIFMNKLGIVIITDNNITYLIVYDYAITLNSLSKLPNDVKITIYNIFFTKNLWLDYLFNLLNYNINIILNIIFIFLYNILKYLQYILLDIYSTSIFSIYIYKFLYFIIENIYNILICIYSTPIFCIYIYKIFYIIYTIIEENIYIENTLNVIKNIILYNYIIINKFLEYIASEEVRYYVYFSYFIIFNLIFPNIFNYFTLKMIYCLFFEIFFNYKNELLINEIIISSIKEDSMFYFFVKPDYEFSFYKIIIFICSFLIENNKNIIIKFFINLKLKLFNLIFFLENYFKNNLNKTDLEKIEKLIKFEKEIIINVKEGNFSNVYNLILQIELKNFNMFYIYFIMYTNFKINCKYIKEDSINLIKEIAAGLLKFYMTIRIIINNNIKLLNIHLNFGSNFIYINLFYIICIYILYSIYDNKFFYLDYLYIYFLLFLLYILLDLQIIIILNIINKISDKERIFNLLNIKNIIEEYNLYKYSYYNYYNFIFFIFNLNIKYYIILYLKQIFKGSLLEEKNRDNLISFLYFMISCKKIIKYFFYIFSIYLITINFFTSIELYNISLYIINLAKIPVFIKNMTISRFCILFFLIFIMLKIRKYALLIIFLSFLFFLIDFLDFINYQYFWLSFKTGICLFLFIIIRATLPRYRYDQLIRLGWKIFLPLSFLFFFIICLLKYILT